MRTKRNQDLGGMSIDDVRTDGEKPWDDRPADDPAYDPDATYISDPTPAAPSPDDARAEPERREIEVPNVTELQGALMWTFNMLSMLRKSEKRFKAGDFSDLAKNLRSLAKRFPVLALVLSRFVLILIAGEVALKWQQIEEQRPRPEPEPTGFFTVMQPGQQPDTDAGMGGA